MEQKFTLYQKLSRIQAELKAPKNLFNKFGNYSYRNVEGIQEALKPYETKFGVMTILSDSIEEINGRVYVKATATIFDTESGESIEVSAYAREAESKKGMDEAQLTGATSSYARKYALNGLFLLDDTKDADSEEYQTQGKQEPKKATPKKETEVKPLSEKELQFLTQRYKGENLNKLLDYYHIEKIEDIDPAVARNLIKQIVEKAKKEQSSK